MMLIDVDRMAKLVSALLCTLLMVAAWPGVARAQQELRGIALVIGQSDYEHLAPLANPANDADAIEELLSDLGFDTTLASDRDARQLTRVLEGFIEDAEDVDVAILYYAGHGIEAGGENYLVPVDADLTALDAAGERLVPITAYLERLKATVPVTILMLDACRDNPFPPDAVVRMAADAEPVPMGEAGLGETRGATRMTIAATPEETYGTVVAFAAEPGRAALDGEPGTNSPYTAAVLRHLDSMAGEEFGTVMRLVAEEVYLKTGGRQQPWVNESLRRLLYFGETPDPVEGPEGEILNERRGLLLTIAALPDGQRSSARRLAEDGDVPMDVVFAMMRAAGIDPSSDPAEIEQRLRTEIERFAENRGARDALHDPDPEIERLTQLADEAELEGALNAADRLRQQAKERVTELRSTRDDQVEALRQRIREDAAVYARSAETKRLLFKHAEVAADYGAAYDIAVEWDRELAYEYRIQQLEAIKNAAFSRGDRRTLIEGETIARGELETPRIIWTPHQKARLTKMLGQMVLIRAQFDDDQALLDESVALFRSLLADPDTTNPDGSLWDIWNDLGGVYHSSANLDGGPEAFRKAAEAFREAEKQLDPGARLSGALAALREAGERNDDAARQSAMKLLEAALQVDNPHALVENWAMVQHNLGAALRGLALDTHEAALRDQALVAYDNAFKARTTIDEKSDAATTQRNIGNLHIDRANDGIEGARAQAIEAYELSVSMLDPLREPVPFADSVLRLTDAILGDQRENAAEKHERALDVLERAVASLDPGAAGADIAEIHNNIGRVQYEVGIVTKDVDAHSAAIAAYRKAATLWQGKPAEVAIASRNLAYALYERSLLDGNVDALREAAAAYEAALTHWTREVSAAEFAQTSFDAARTDHQIASLVGDRAAYETAAAGYRDALSVWADPTADENWPWAHSNLGSIAFGAGIETGDLDRFREAAASYETAASGFRERGQGEAAADADFERGRALHEIGVAIPDAATLRGAVDAYLAADAVYSDLPETPENRGYALSNAAMALRAIADLTGSDSDLRRAVDFLEGSIDLPTTDEAEILARRMRLASATQAVAEGSRQPSDFAEAIVAGEALVATLSRETAPEEWADWTNSFAYTLLRAGQAGGERALLLRAVETARSATELQRRIDAVPALGFSEDTLCEALITLGRLDGDRASLAQGIEACQRSIAILEVANLPEVLEISRQNLARGQQALGEIQSR
jgi:uncharacterized caspase-like protein